MTDNTNARAKSALLSRPYDERERITVVDNVTAKTVAKKAGKAGLWGGATYFGSAFGYGFAVGLGFAGPAGAVAAVPIILSRPAYKFYRSRRHKKKAHNLHILMVGKQEARLLNFPENHPKERHLYVGNPASAPEYYPAANFQRLTLEHKAWEASQLLMALGATYLKVEGTATHTQELQGKIEGASEPVAHLYAHDTQGRIVGDEWIYFHTSERAPVGDMDDKTGALL
jgi:hypothetical protein